MNLRDLVPLAGLFLAYLGYSRWRQGVRAALLLLVLEGGIRKWLLPDAQDLAYFTKDVLLLGVYLGYVTSPAARRTPRAMPPSLLTALALAVGWGALEVFNPRLPNPLVGILGFKAYFLYVPLLWVVPAAFASDRDLARFLRRFIAIALPVGMLAIAQFLSPATSPLNAYARSAGATPFVATFGSSPQVRVTGPFSYITGFASYLLATAILVLALLAATRWRYRGNLATYGALALTLGGMLMSGSRAPIVLLGVLLPLYGWLGVAREREGGTMAGRILLGAAVLAALLSSVGGEAVAAFYGRAAGTRDLASRITAPLVQPLEVLPEAGPFGFGIGATHQTAAAVAPGLVPYSWLRGWIVEGESGQVMLELGPFGFLLVYFVRFAIALWALRLVFLLRTPFHRAMATSCVLFFAAHLAGGVVFNVTADVFHWFFAGLLALVVRLDRDLALGPAVRLARRTGPRGLEPRRGVRAGGLGSATSP